MLSLIFLIKCALENAITAAALETGKGQPFRKRKLSIADVIQLLIGAEGGSLARELHRAGVEVTASAISQRRAQIPPEVFQDVFARFNAASTDPETFRGCRVLAVDGTSVNLPRNPNAPSFVCNEGAPPC